MKKGKILVISLLAVLLLFAFSAFAGAETLGYGDVDADGKITASDARLALRAAVNFDDHLRDIQKTAANVDGEGDITSADARLILRAAVNLEKLTGTVHTHEPGAAVREKDVAATCTENGSYEDVVYCTECGEELSREGQTVKATGHTPGAAVREKEVAATCTTEGSYDEVVYCTVCGDELSRKTVSVPMKDHTPGATVRENEVAAACTTAGSYDEVVKCTVCNNVLSTTKKTVAALGHIKTLDESKSTFLLTGNNVLIYSCSRCGKNGNSDSTLRATVKLGNTTTQENVDVINHFLNSVKQGKTTFHLLSLSNSDYKISNVKYNADRIMTWVLEQSNKDVPASEKFPTSKSEFESMLKNFLNDEGEHNARSPLPTNVEKYTFPLAGKTVVSELEAADLQSAKVERISEYDFISSMPATVHNTHYRLYSETSYYDLDDIYLIDYDTNERFVKKLPTANDIVKITLTLKDESSNDFGAFVANSKFSHIFDLNSAGISTDDLEDAFSFADEGEDFFSGSSSNSVSAKGSVTYYFDANTSTPLAAVYDSKYSTSNVMDMNFKVSITADWVEKEFGRAARFAFLALGGWIINGRSLASLELGASINADNTNTSYYIFNPVDRY